MDGSHSEIDRGIKPKEKKLVKSKKSPNPSKMTRKALEIPFISKRTGVHINPGVAAGLIAAGEAAAVGGLISLSGGMGKDNQVYAAENPAPAEHTRQVSTDELSHPSGLTIVPIEEKQPEPPKSEIEAPDELPMLRAQIIKEVLPGLSPDEIQALSQAIDHEMEGRSRDDMADVIAKFDEYVQEASSENNIPKYLIYGVMGAESQYDPNAVSEVGAVGLGGIMEGAGIDTGIVDPANGIDNRTDPRSNILAIGRYLRINTNAFGGKNLGFGIQGFKTGAGHLEEYTNEYRNAYGVDAENAYQVVNDDHIKNILNDPADSSYIPRVLGHAEEFLEAKIGQ